MENPRDREAPWPRRGILPLVVAGLCASTFLLGLAVLIGWFTGSTRLMQIAPSFVPMQFNTALGFAAAAVAVAALDAGRYRPATGLGALVAGLGVATLLQYLFSVDLGIDELFMEHQVTVQTSHPGRMAPNTALCFALVGITLVVAGPVERIRRQWIISMGGSLVCALGTVAFLGYLGNVETAYGWGQLTRMALHTAVGFQLLGAALAAYAWERTCGSRIPLDSTWPYLLPVTTALVTLAVGLWVGLRDNEDLLVLRDVSLEADRVATVVDRDISLRIASLRRMASRWEQRGGTPEQEWRADALNYVRDETGYQAVGWADAANRLRWVVRVDGSQTAVGLDLAGEPIRGAALEEARRTGTVTATGPVDLVTGGRGFVVVIPIRRAELTDGLIVGVYLFEALLDEILRDEPDGYGIAIVDAAEEIYRRGKPDDQADAPTVVVRDISVHGRTWRISVWPAPEVLALERSSLPTVVLLFTLTVALLVPAILVASARSRRVSARLDEMRVALEAHVAKLDDVIAACPDGIVIIDDQGRIVLVNDQAERMFGYARRELIGEPIELLQPEAERAHHVSLRDDFLAAPRKRRMADFSQTLLARRKDGTQFPVDIGLSPIQTADGLQVISAIADVSERVEAERVATRRTRELERSNADLEQFAYVAAHDLQEPLRMVASYTELLGQRYEGQLDDRADKFIGYAVDGARRMQQLLQDLLAYSRVGTGATEMTDTDAAAVVERVVATLEMAMAEADAEVIVEELPVVTADPSQLEQLFQNLIGNALKFRREGVAPRVHVRAERTESRWVFAVQDNGIGIDPQYFERVFRVFQRLHARGEYDGSGIGLAIARKIAERHGGTLWVESEPGGGSTFFFSLAASTAEPESAA